MAVIGTKNGYSILRKFPGFKPQLRNEMLLRDKAFSGDMVVSPSITTWAPTATTTTGTWTKSITVWLKDAAGNVHDWFCGYLNCSLTDHSATAIFSISGGVATTIYLNGGVTVITLVSTTGPYLAATTVGLHLWRENLLGNPVSTVSITGTFA
jgi:hypothetical protein